jgi:hypothetical protein
MKLAITADWHVRGKTIEDATAQIEAFINECQARGIRHVIHCGDVFDRPNIYDGHVSTGAIAEVVSRAIVRSDMEWLIVAGNHDTAGVGSRTALAVLMGLPGVTVFERPGLFESWGVSVAVFPWCWDYAKGTADDALSDLMMQGHPALLAGHASVLGALYSNGQTSRWSNDSWMLTPEALDAIGIPVFLGDYHRRQKYYVGALLQQNHGEEANPMGFVVYDTQTQTEEWVPLGAARCHMTIEIHSEKDSLVIPPRVHARVRTIGFRPSAALRAHYECVQEIGSTIRWEPVIEARLRESRLESETINLSDKMSLFRLWASRQNPPIEHQERVEAWLSALIGGGQ